MLRILLIATSNKLINKVNNFCEKHGFIIVKRCRNINEAKKCVSVLMPEYVFVECGDGKEEKCLKTFYGVKTVLFSQNCEYIESKTHIVLPQSGFNQKLFGFLSKHSLIGVERKTGRVVDLKKSISTFCLEIGILPHLSGYKYVIYAIIVTILNVENAKYLTKQVYPKVAQKFGVSESVVERTIRHALIVAGKTGKLAKINDLIEADVFSPTERISNGQFISLVADRFLFKLKIANGEMGL